MRDPKDDSLWRVLEHEVEFDGGYEALLTLQMVLEEKRSFYWNREHREANKARAYHKIAKQCMMMAFELRDVHRAQ